MSTGSLQFPPSDSRPVGSVPSRFPYLRREVWRESLGPWLHELREDDRRGLLVANDAMVLTLAWFCGGALAGSTWSLGYFALWTAIVVAALYGAEQYSLEPHDERVFGKSLIAASLGALALSWGADLSRFPQGLIAAACLGFLGLAVSRRCWNWLFSGQSARRGALLLCTLPEAEDALREIRRHPLSGIRALGMISDHGIAGEAPLSMLGTPQQLPILAEAWRPKSIVAGPSAVQQTEWRHALPQGEETLDLPGLFERLSHRVPVRHVDERWFIEQFSWNRGLGYLVTKRVVDVLFSLFGIAVSVPFLPLVAIANMLDDRGPLFYSQERVGLNGKNFRVYKLRTMRVDAEKHGAVWAQTKDPRVTRLGNMLRRSRLDEIPQLWNVLKGEMSLVGPRPERPPFVQELEQQIPHYQRRHLVPPGVTGWAQVRFPYGSSVQDAEEKLKFDLYYVKHRSILFDLLILLRTVSVVINKTGSR